MNRLPAPTTSVLPRRGTARSAGTLTALVLALGLGAGAVPLQAGPAVAAVAATPSSITTVTSQPGPDPGEVTITWTGQGLNTTHFVIETGLTSFSKTDPNLPVHARGWKLFTVAGTQRSVTLTAAQTASAGASVGSGNHLYFRLHAANRASDGTEVTRYYPYLQTVAVRPAVPAATGTPLRAATFNVRTARATTDPRTWLQRVPDVARQILDKKLDVVALQELGPGRADGLTGTTQGTPRQTDSLLTELAAQGGGRYKLVRTTPYVKAGTPTDTQGMRILYDSTKYELLSDCVDRTSAGSFSPSCSVDLPIRSSGDTENNRRRAAYAELGVKATGERFFVVSVHLDPRHDADVEVEKTYDALRGAQAQATIDALEKLNPNGYPVVLGGDLNTWQNSKVGYAGHDRFIAADYYDTAAAQERVNINYNTSNGFAEVVQPNGSGYGSRIDAVLVKGISGARYWENVLKPTDPARPSDHNMVLADVRLPVAPPDSYQPVTPTRIVDTRAGLGAPAGAVGAGKTIDVTVAGRAGVPTSGVSAVVLNLTSTGAAGTGYLTAYPSGEELPAASTLNYAAGQPMANNVVVKVGAGGKVRLYTSAASQVAVDVQGWFPTGADFTAVSPARVLDTRAGTGAARGALPAGGRIDLTLTGRGGVPLTGVGAVVLNLTATEAVGAGYLTAYPAGEARATASSLNFVRGQSTANGVIVKVGAGGKVSIFGSTTAHVVADVQGWFPTGSDLTALAPTRILDTRSGSGTTTKASLPTQGRIDVTVTGRAGVPASGVRAVVLNVTSTRATASGYATVYAAGSNRTDATNLAFTPGRSIANRVIAEVGADGKVSLHATAETHLIADVVGYLAD